MDLLPGPNPQHPLSSILSHDHKHSNPHSNPTQNLLHKHCPTHNTHSSRSDAQQLKVRFIIKRAPVYIRRRPCKMCTVSFAPGTSTDTCDARGSGQSACSEYVRFAAKDSDSDSDIEGDAGCTVYTGESIEDAQDAQDAQDAKDAKDAKDSTPSVSFDGSPLNRVFEVRGVFDGAVNGFLGVEAGVVNDRVHAQRH